MTFFAAISLVGSVLGGVGQKGQACNNCAAAYGLEATSASTATLPRCHAQHATQREASAARSQIARKFRM